MEIIKKTKGPKQFIILIGLFLIIGYGLINLQLLPRYLDYDQMVYIGNIRAPMLELEGYYILFNPHHLHFEITGQYFHKLMNYLGGEKGLNLFIFNLRLRSLITACFTLFLFYVFIYRETKSLIWSIIGVIFLGFTHSYYFHATKIDTPVFAACGFLMLLILFQSWKNLKKTNSVFTILTGIILCISLLFHQYLGFSCVIFTILLLIPKSVFRLKLIKTCIHFIHSQKENQKEKYLPKLLHLIFANLVAIFLLGLCYFYVGRVYYKLPFEGEKIKKESVGVFKDLSFQKYLFAYQVSQGWGYGLKYFNPKAPIRGISDSFLTQIGENKYNKNYTFKYDFKNLFSNKSIIHNQLALFLMIVIVGNIFFLPQMIKSYGSVFVFLFINLIIYSIYFTYWEPYYFEFWLIPLILLCTLGILFFHQLSCLFTPLFSRIFKLPFIFYFIWLTILLAGYNLNNYIIPSVNHPVAEGIPRKIFPQEYLNECYVPNIYKNPENPLIYWKKKK